MKQHIHAFTLSVYLVLTILAGFALLLYPSGTLAYDYSRTPPDFTIPLDHLVPDTAQVTISFSAATSTDPAFDGWEGNVLSWTLGLSNGEELLQSTNCPAWVPDNYSDGYSYNLPVHSYESVTLIGFTDDSCTEVFTYFPLETDESSVIFEVIPDPVEPVATTTLQTSDMFYITNQFLIIIVFWIFLVLTFFRK